MTEDTYLIERREELKRQLEEGQYKTLVDVILYRVSGLIMRITRSTQEVSIGYSGTIIFLITFLIGIIAVVLFGEFTLLQDFITSLSFRVGLFLFVGAALATGSMMAINAFIGNVFTTMQEIVLDKVESTGTLADIQRWLEAVCNKRLVLIGSIIGGTIGGIYGSSIVVSTVAGYFVGFGITILMALFSIQSAIFIIYLLLVLVLALSLRRYELSLYVGNPSSSKVISRLSGALSNFVYLVAIYGAILTFGSASLGALTSFSILIFPFLWVPIIAIFVVTQYGLASIIRRDKEKTLEELQKKIEDRYPGKGEKAITDKESMEAIIRLMDYHDRIKATPNSAFDLRAGLNFINSLLLPLLGFLLGNLDLVFGFFS